MTSFSNFKTTLVKKVSEKAGLSLASGAQVVTEASGLPAASSTADLAYVSSADQLFMRGQSAWYSLPLVNTEPSITVNSQLLIIPTGESFVFEPTAQDPENTPVEWGYEISGDSQAFTVNNNNGVFTITESGNTPSNGLAILTVTATDGLSIGTKQVTLVLEQFAVGLAESSPASSAQAIMDTLGPQASGYYWIKPTGADVAVKVYCWFTSTDAWMLVNSTTHDSGNSMINGNPSSSVGFVQNSDDSTLVDGSSYDIFNTNSYLRVNRDWMDRLEAQSGGSLNMAIMAFNDTNSPSAIEEYTHIRDTGDVLTDFPGAFVRSSSNGMYNMGGSWYMSDYSGLAYGSYHQGVINDWTTPGYHGNDRGSHFGHYHRSGVNAGTYCFGDDVYIQGVEWNARFLYFVK